MGSKFRKQMRKASNFDIRIPGSGCDCCDWSLPHGSDHVHNHGPSASDVIEKEGETDATFEAFKYAVSRNPHTRSGFIRVERSLATIVTGLTESEVYDTFGSTYATRGDAE